MGQQFELGVCRHNEDSFLAADVIQPPAGKKRIGVNGFCRGIEPLLVNQFAGFRIDAVDNSVCVLGPVKVAVVINWRRNVGAFSGLPQFMGFRYVSFAAGSNGYRDAFFSADGVQNSVLSDQAGADIFVDAGASPTKFFPFADPRRGSR